LSLSQNPVASKPCTGINRMSNQREAEFVNSNFHIQSSGKVMAKFCQIPDLCQKVQFA
jgi:hypothetical protein